MKRTATKEDTLKPEFMTNDLFESFDLNKLLVKMAIGYAYGVVAYIGGVNIINMVIMMTNMVWLQYVIAFAGLVALLITIFKTAPLVADTIYDAGTYAANKAKSLFTSAKAKFNGFEMPAFATKH